jgi:hypothetical protein
MASIYHKELEEWPSMTSHIQDIPKFWHLSNFLNTYWGNGKKAKLSNFYFWSTTPPHISYNLLIL